MSFEKITAGKNVPQEINVIIEIPGNSPPIKYELDKESQAIFVDRFISTAMYYPCNYGYVPKTLSKDGDPLDVLVMTPIPLMPGCVIKARPVGMLKMVDESGEDLKILAVPVNKLTPEYQKIVEYTDLPEVTLKKIEHFFTHYKDNEPGKWAKVEGWVGKEAACQAIVECIEAYERI